VSRLLLLVEAFISLRHVTPGMLALVKHLEKLHFQI
jgi:hypothetical protein